MVETKVWCKNILCKGTPFKAEIIKNLDLKKQFKKIRCPHCGKIGVMQEDDFLSTEDILKQIASWSNAVLYKKAFKSINYKKLPDTIIKQKMRNRSEKRIKITKPIIRR